MPSPRHARILVTGGAGFIGREVVRALCGDPDKSVVIVDDLSAGLPMPSTTSRLTTITADIRDGEAMSGVFNEFSPSAVIHLAAIHHIPTCERKRAKSLGVNVVGTEAVLEAAERSGVSRFVLASSGAVYDWMDRPLNEETTPLRPADNYSLAKHANEMQVRLWAERTGSDAVIARIFNTIGRDDPNAHLVPDIISQIPSGAERVEIALGNLSPRRDYIHVEDTARALAGLACAPLTSQVEIFNIATGEEQPVAGLVALLGEVMGVRIDIREDPLRKRRIDRPSQRGDIAKIARRLNFAPAKSLREALSDIVAQSEWRKQASQ